MSATWLGVRPLDAVLTGERNDSHSACALLVAVTRPARFADHFSPRTTQTGWSCERSPWSPARFARTSPPPLSARRVSHFELEVIIESPCCRAASRRLRCVEGSTGGIIRHCPPPRSSSAVLRGTCACPPRHALRYSCLSSLRVFLPPRSAGSGETDGVAGTPRLDARDRNVGRPAVRGCRRLADASPRRASVIGYLALGSGRLGT